MVYVYSEEINEPKDPDVLSDEEEEKEEENGEKEQDQSKDRENFWEASIF